MADDASAKAPSGKEPPASAAPAAAAAGRSAARKAAPAASRWSGPRSSFQLVCSALFFILVVFQLPFFEVRQKKEEVLVDHSASAGSPKPKHSLVRVSPIQVVVSQLMLSGSIPDDYFRAALWPGAAWKQAKRTFECEIGYRTIGCRKKAKYLPTWKSLIHTHDPRKVDELMTAEFKERKVQLVAGSFFCALGALIVPFSRSRLPFFGMVMFLYPLLRRGIWPSAYLLIACGCSLSVIHLGGLARKAGAAAAASAAAATATKPAATAKKPNTKQAQLEEARARLAELENQEKAIRALKQARKIDHTLKSGGKIKGV